MEHKKNSLKIAAIILVALLVGFVGTKIFWPTVKTVTETKTVTVEVPKECPVQSCPTCENKTTTVEVIKYKECTSKSDLKDKDAIKKVATDTGKSVKDTSVITTTRSCSNWLAIEKKAGNVESNVEGAPFCWKYLGKNDRKIGIFEPKGTGCRIVYSQGC